MAVKVLASSSRTAVPTPDFTAPGPRESLWAPSMTYWSGSEVTGLHLEASPGGVMMSERTWLSALQGGEDVVEQNRSHQVLDRQPDSPTRTEVRTENAADVRQPPSPRWRTGRTRQLAEGERRG